MTRFARVVATSARKAPIAVTHIHRCRLVGAPCSARRHGRGRHSATSCVKLRGKVRLYQKSVARSIPNRYLGIGGIQVTDTGTSGANPSIGGRPAAECGRDERDSSCQEQHRPCGRERLCP